MGNDEYNGDNDDNDDENSVMKTGRISEHYSKTGMKHTITFSNKLSNGNNNNNNDNNDDDIKSNKHVNFIDVQPVYKKAASSPTFDSPKLEIPKLSLQQSLSDNPDINSAELTPNNKNGSSKRVNFDIQPNLPKKYYSNPNHSSIKNARHSVVSLRMLKEAKKLNQNIARSNTEMYSTTPDPHSNHSKFNVKNGKYNRRNKRESSSLPFSKIKANNSNNPASKINGNKKLKQLLLNENTKTDDDDDDDNDTDEEEHKRRIEKVMNTEIINKLIPSTVAKMIHRIVSKQRSNHQLRKVVCPQNWEFKTCALFADVSGFTKLSESLAKAAGGAEKLAFYLNRYLEQLALHVRFVHICVCI